MFEKVFHTEIEIDAEAERVWEVLTDFSSYHEWNPMIRRASGELQVGTRLQLHFEPTGRPRFHRLRFIDTLGKEEGGGLGHRSLRGYEPGPQRTFGEIRKR
jgi:hypothetical protein